MAQDPPSSAAVPVAELEYEHSALEDAVIRYRKQLILVAVLAVVGSVGYFGNKLWKESQAKAAAIAFTRAQTVGDLRSVADAHAGQNGAGNALIDAARLLAQDGKGKDAISELEQFLTTYPQHPLTELAKFRLADLQLAEGASQDAVSRFQEIAQNPASPYSPLARLRMADQMWQEGKTSEAEALYQELQKRSGGDRLFAIAEQRLKHLKAAPPVPVEFVPEPAAPPDAATLPPGLNMAPPSENTLSGTINSPGLLDDNTPDAGTSLTPDGAPESDTLLPPPVLPPVEN